jgi:hypothetical protein
MRLKTKQEITDLINSGLESEEIGNLYYSEDHLGHHIFFDYDEFSAQQPNHFESKAILEQNLEQVYDQEGGDGQLITRTFWIKPYQMYVTVEGTYSSWEGHDFYDCYISEPFCFQEVRYKKKTEQ